MEMLGYCVRVDAREGYAEKIRMLPTCTDYLSIVSVKHKGTKGENPHYHLVIRTGIRQQAFRVRLKKIFDQGKGNGHMSIKPWDGCIDAISYLFHEDESAELLVCHNVSDETIAQARSRNAEVQREMEKAKERASWTLEEQVYNHYVGQDMDWISDEQVATELILIAFRSGKYMPNDYLLKAMVRRVRFRLLGGDVTLEEQYARSLAENIFRR